MPLGWSMLHCSLIVRCIARCRKGFVRPSSTSNTAASAASTSARSAWYSGCSAIHCEARIWMGDIGAPLAASAWVSQKKRRTSCWDGWNMS